MLLITLLISLALQLLGVDAAATYRVSNGGSSPDTIFSLAIDNSTKDIFFHLEGPSNMQWLAAAMGTQMSNALFFIVYPAGTGSDITISPRLSRGEIMPTLTDQVTCTLVDGPNGNVYNSTMYSANVRCQNATSWTNMNGQPGMLDLTSNAANFLLGYGPAMSNPAGGSNTARINQHTNIPSGFTLDVASAVVASTSTTNNNGSSTGAGVPSTSDISSAGPAQPAPMIISVSPSIVISHAFFALVAFAVVMPIGSMFPRLFGMMRTHWIIQTFGTIFATIAIGLGLYMATSYNRFFGHQILGLVAWSLAVIQWIIGAGHHGHYKRTSVSSSLKYVHRVLGPIVIILGFANGFVGFDYAGDDGIIWIPAVLLAFTIVVWMIGGFIAWKMRKSRTSSRGGDSNLTQQTETTKTEQA